MFRWGSERRSKESDRSWIKRSRCQQAHLLLRSLQRIARLGQSRRQRICTNRAAAKHYRQRLKVAHILLIQSNIIDAETFKRGVRDTRIDNPMPCIFG